MYGSAALYKITVISNALTTAVNEPVVKTFKLSYKILQLSYHSFNCNFAFNRFTFKQGFIMPSSLAFSALILLSQLLVLLPSALCVDI